MGTRADFYIGKGKAAIWVGSVSHDGYPATFPEFKNIKTGRAFKARIRQQASYIPPDKWPWPWSTSSNTEYAYTFSSGKVWVSNYGHHWVPYKKYKLMEVEIALGAKARAIFPLMQQNMKPADWSGILPENGIF